MKKRFEKSDDVIADTFEWDPADTAVVKGGPCPDPHAPIPIGYSGNWHIIADVGNPKTRGRYIVARQNPHTGFVDTSTKAFCTTRGWSGPHNVLAWADLPIPPQGI